MGIFTHAAAGSGSFITKDQVDTEIEAVQTAVTAARDYFTINLKWLADLTSASGTVTAQAVIPEAATLVSTKLVATGWTRVADSTIAIFKRTAVSTSATCMTTEHVLGTGYTALAAHTSSVVDATKASFSLGDIIELVATGAGSTLTGVTVTATFKKAFA